MMNKREEELKDHLVEMMIDIVEAMETSGADAKLLITLSVGGLLISGKVIREEQYMARFLDGSVQEIINKAVKSGKLELPPTKKAHDFIHLADARFFSPGNLPIPSEGGVLWRGKISAIDGFTLGELREGVRGASQQ